MKEQTANLAFKNNQLSWPMTYRSYVRKICLWNYFLKNNKYHKHVTTEWKVKPYTPAFTHT